MSAADALHPFQMRLFMQANELMDLPAGDSMQWSIARKAKFASLNEDPELQERKRQESQHVGSMRPSTLGSDKTFSEEVKEHGVLRPISLFYRPEYGHTAPQIDDGHHRVVAAYDANPESWVPVRYH